MVSDCGTLDRIGAVRGRHPELFDRLPRVVIDHHASNDATGETDWIEPDAAATCEMVTLLVARLGLPLDSGDGALAAALMAGIVMDTATFAHPNATPRTLAVSAALVEAGAPLSDISRRLYRSKPSAQLRLFGRVLDRLDAADSGRVIHSTLLDADLAATGTTPAQSEGIIDLLAQADEAEVAILFKEAGPATRISVRTKPGGVDATVLTGTFGGGGHARAAGATVELPVDQARTGRPRRGQPPRRRGRALTVAHKSLGPGLDGILIVDKPVGPTSHDIVGPRPAARRHEAGRPRRHAGSVRIGRPAAVPRPRDPGRRVPPRRPEARIGRRSASAPRRRPTTSRASSRWRPGPRRRRRASRRPCRA